MTTHRIFLIGALLSAGAFAAVAKAQVQTRDQMIAAQKARDDLARRQFIEITTMLRSTPDEQARQIGAAYELFSQIKETTTFFSSIIYSRAPMPPNAARLSPDELADFITRRVGNQYLSIEAKANGRELLLAHPDVIAPLVRRDLRSIDPALVKRGLDTLLDLRGVKFGLYNDISIPKDVPPSWTTLLIPEVERIFGSEDDAAPSNVAVQALVALRDSRAIALLIGKDPRHPTRYYGAINQLSGSDRQNPALLSLLPRLNSKDSRERFESLYALGRVDEATLFPHVRQLLDDADAQVRWLAVSNAFALKPDHFTELKPRLLKALNDRDEFVSWVAASGFVRRNELVAAPTLLRLLKSPTISLSVRQAVADDVRRLMGRTFDYIVDGSVVPQPNIAESNQRAVAQFEQWIQQHNAT